MANIMINIRLRKYVPSNEDLPIYTINQHTNHLEYIVDNCSKIKNLNCQSYQFDKCYSHLHKNKDVYQQSIHPLI